MKILFLVRFYQPFDRGGSEWSTHDLAYLLSKAGHKVTILTPNYGSQPKEIKKNIIIYRFPFPKKLKKPKSAITPWWTNNLIWFIYSSMICTFYVLKNKVDIIHIQNNEFIPAGVISAKLTKTPLIVTFRDYQSLCNLGFCLWEKDIACNLLNYIKKDFNFFYKYYIDKKNFVKYLILLIAAMRGYLMQKIIKFFAGFIECKVTVSKKVSIIFSENWVKDLTVINNAVLVPNNPARKSDNTVVFLGKLSIGKGADLVVQAFLKFSRNFPETELKMIGSGVLKNKLITITKNNKNIKIKLIGQVDHQQALDELKKAGLVIVPSVWQEPLPRSAIESLLLGTPLVVTNRGGTREIIKKSYGIVTTPNIESLESAMISAYEKKGFFKKNIIKDLKELKRHFSIMSLNKHLELYKKAIS